MPAGAEFYTDAGIVQIDETAPVLCLRYMGTATVVNRHPASLNTSFYIAKTVDITVTAEAPIVALAGPGGYGVIAAIQNGNNWTFRIIGYEHNPTFQYFIFDKPPASTSGAGFEVSDASGNVVFSSLYRPFVPVAFAPDPNGSSFIQLPTGRSYAAICNARITLYENSEHYTDNTIWTFWTYDLTTGYAGPSTIGGSDNGIGFLTNAIAGGVNQGPTSPVAPSGDLGGWGAGTSLLGIDVTDLIGGPVNPGGPVVTVNATARTANGTGSGTTVTDAVTASATGGSAPYAFQWDKITGEAGIVAYGATNTAGLRTQVVNQIAGSTMTSTWRCRVTDNAGRVNFSPEVTMVHVQAAGDQTPNPISVANLTLNTNDPSGLTNASFFQITGINQPITLRFTRANQWDSGGIFTRRLFIYRSTSGSGGPWTEYFIGAGAQGVADIPANNGDWFYVQAYCDTNAGIGQTSFNGYVTNLTTGVQLASFLVTATVDADNNYNVAPVDDYTPDSFTLPTMSVSSNAPDVSWSTTSFGTYTVNGINKPITVRFERYDYSGNLNALHIDVFTWPPGASGWTHHGYYNAHDAGMRYMDIPNVVNGTRIAYNAHAITHSGRRSGSCRFVLWALEPNVQFAASASCSFTVDADDNFNVGAGGNAPFSMPFLSAFGSNGYASEMIVGPVMTAAETLTIETSVPSGLATSRAAYFTIASSGGSALSFSWGSNAAKSGTVNVIAGQTLNASIELSNYTMSGNRSIAFTVTIKNASGTTLSTFNVNASASAEGGIEV